MLKQLQYSSSFLKVKMSKLRNSRQHTFACSFTLQVLNGTIAQVQDDGQGPEVRVRGGHPRVLARVRRGPRPGAVAAVGGARGAADGGGVPGAPLALGRRHLHERPQRAGDHLDAALPRPQEVRHKLEFQTKVK